MCCYFCVLVFFFLQLSLLLIFMLTPFFPVPSVCAYTYFLLFILSITPEYLYVRICLQWGLIFFDFLQLCFFLRQFSECTERKSDNKFSRKLSSSQFLFSLFRIRNFFFKGLVILTFTIYSRKRNPAPFLQEAE